jgi:hypothetical protein
LFVLRRVWQCGKGRGLDADLTCFLCNNLEELDISVNSLADSLRWEHLSYALSINA